jgi:hypothetical protein
MLNTNKVKDILQRFETQDPFKQRAANSDERRIYDILKQADLIGDARLTDKGKTVLNDYRTLAKKYGSGGVEILYANVEGNGYTLKARAKPNAKEKGHGGKVKDIGKTETLLQTNTSFNKNSTEGNDTKIPSQVALPPEIKTNETNIKDYLQGIKDTYPIISSISESGNSLVLKTRILHSRDRTKFEKVAVDIGLSLTGGKSNMEEDTEKHQFVDSRNYVIKGSDFYDKITLSSERVAKRTQGNLASAFKEQPLKIIISPNYKSKEDVEKLLKSLSKNFKYKEKNKSNV